MDAADILLDPTRMLVVEYDVPGVGVTRTASLSVRYVPVPRPEGPVIAMEIVFDPSRPAPTAPYRCPRASLRRLLLAPAIVRAVRPLTPGAEPHHHAG